MVGEALGRRQRESEGGRMGERVITQRGPVTAEARTGVWSEMGFPIAPGRSAASVHGEVRGEGMWVVRAQNNGKGQNSMANDGSVVV